MEMVAFGKVVAGTLRMLYWKIVYMCIYVYIYMMKVVYSLEMSGMLVPHSELVG